MTFKLLNRVRMSLLSAPGTGACALNAAAVGFQGLSVDLADGDSTPYVLEDGSPLGSVWEYGVGTYHNNGTFTRDTVTRSSLGGTTKITATSDAILNATIRAEDLTPPAPPAVPSLVQYGSVDVSTTGLISITLGAAPTAGNLLVLVGFGGSGGAGLFGTEEGDFDRQQSWPLSTQYTIGYSMRTVRSGDGATYNIGEGDAGGSIPLAAVYMEIAGADPTKLSEFLMTQGSAGVSGTHDLTVLAEPGALILGFIGGDFGGGLGGLTSIVNLTTPAQLVAGQATAANNYGSMTFTWGGGTTNALLMAIPGF